MACSIITIEADGGGEEVICTSKNIGVVSPALTTSWSQTTRSPN